MPALNLVITTAGKAALISANNTGTDSVFIAEVGVSATNFAHSAATVVLPGELKRLDTIAGQVVADDTFHISVADRTDDVYGMKSFALYLDDGTLFAVYSQAAVIVEKAAVASILLDADILLASPLAGVIEFAESSWSNPPASETVSGVTRYATQAEATAGVAGSKSVSPATLLGALNARFGVGAPSAFVKTLLTAATAAAFRVLIAVKSAALKDEGAGNGLDADLLDAQHGAYYLAWGNLTGKPLTFPPSAHSTAWVDLTGVPAFASRWPTFAEVSGKPATYAPDAHVHDAADTTTGVFSIARIPDLAQAKITGLVAALAGKSPTDHVHDAADTTTGVFLTARIPDLAQAKITGLVAALAGKAANDHVHDAADTTTGVFITARIPDLAMTKITGLVDTLATKVTTGSQAFITLLHVTSTAPTINLIETGRTQNWRLWVNDGAFYVQEDNAGDGVFEGPDPLAFERAGLRAEVWGHALWHAGNFAPPAAATATAQGLVELATPAEVVTGTDAVRAATPAGVKAAINAIPDQPSASTTVKGLVELTTNAEAQAGTDTTRALTTAALWSFAKSMGSSGYLQIPGTDLILQWGILTGMSGVGSKTVSFPTTFPTACRFCIGQINNTGADAGMDSWVQGVGSPGTTSATLLVNQTSGATPTRMDWFAIGY